MKVTLTGQNVSPAVKQLVELLTARWPNHKKDPAQIILYRDDVAALVEECGLSRVQAAAEKARTWCSFLPEPAELREFLPAIEYIRPTWQQRDPRCQDCRGNGWKLVTVIDRGEADQRATRCACKAPAVSEPEPRPNLQAYHDFLAEALERIKRIDPPPDPNRLHKLKEQLAQVRKKPPACANIPTACGSEANTA